MKNIKNEVYNALANIMFETGASKEDMNEAIKWFNEKFYDEDNEESAEMNSEEEQIHEADANVFTEDADENLVERKQMKANELVVGKNYWCGWASRYGRFVRIENVTRCGSTESYAVFRDDIGCAIECKVEAVEHWVVESLKKERLK